MGNHKRGIYNTKAKEGQRKQLRNSLTIAEAVLWKNLKDSQLSRKKFRRQESIGPYIADFYCPESRLIVELDGSGHYQVGGAEYDAGTDDILAVTRSESDSIRKQSGVGRFRVGAGSDPEKSRRVTTPSAP